MSAASTAWVAPRRSAMLELVPAPVDGDDRRRARQPRAGDHLQADAAAADHAHLGRRSDAGGVGDGADPGHHAAAQQRRLPQRDVGGDAGSRRRPARPRSSAKQATISPCWSTVPSAARSREVPSSSIPATDWRPPGSHSVRRPDRHALADAARRDEAEHDVIAGRELGRRPRPPPRRRRRPRGRAPSATGPSPSSAVGEVDVGVADAGGGDPDEHLAASRRLEPAPSRPATGPTGLAQHGTARDLGSPPSGACATRPRCQAELGRPRARQRSLVDACRRRSSVERDVTADRVAGLLLVQRRLGGLADLADLARAAGLERASAAADRRRSGSRPRAGSAARPSVVERRHRRQQRLGVGVVRPAEHLARPVPISITRPRYSTAIRSDEVADDAEVVADEQVGDVARGAADR